MRAKIKKPFCLPFYVILCALISAHIHAADAEESIDISQTFNERKKWKPKEIALLKRLIIKKHITDWKEIAKKIPGRSAKQCRQRWISQDDPAIVKGPLSEQEWRVFDVLHNFYGNQWARIATHLPGRTANHLKNIWYARARKGFSSKRTLMNGLDQLVAAAFILDSED